MNTQRDAEEQLTRPMSSTTRARFRVAIVAVAPAVLLAGFVYHPYISPPTDEAAVAAAAASDTMRWGIAHLTIGVGYGLVVLAFLAIRSYLREVGEERWSVLALPPIVLGSTLFVILTGMEIALAAAAETGGDVQATQAALFPWFVPILLTGAVSFALGAVGFAKGIARSAVLSPGVTRLVGGALLVMAVARFVPLSTAPYVIAAGGVVALWPLAYEMWRHPEVQSAAQARPLPAT
jgi:cytochrome bd-type quinol oxidase subunit 2